MLNRLETIINNFDFKGKFENICTFGRGHINETYVITFNDGNKKRKYTLQKINVFVFKDPYGLMDNIVSICNFLKKKNSPGSNQKILFPIELKNGGYLYKDSEGEFWRAYNFIDHVICLDVCESDEDFYQSAIAFGRFQRMLSDFPANTLNETIPKFHDTPSRFEDFKKIVKADPLGRASAVRKCIDFALEREKEADILKNMLDKGELPLRVTHNDTKLNNVLFDENTREAICVVDLDTVMPGLSIHDYGDSIRFGATKAAEDEIDIQKVKFDLDLFEIYTKGFLETCGNNLTENEIKMMPMAAKLITLECGIRFLGDHINGDKYFRINMPGQNYIRGRNQLKLVSDMEKSWDKMQDIVANTKF